MTGREVIKRDLNTGKTKQTELRRAFTLIELLVVIGIIAIIAALLFPVLAKAKEKGYRAQCLNNLKQLAVATQSYADDHGDELPGPLWQGVQENYDNEDRTRLLFYIAAPLGQPAPSPTAQNAPQTRCPSAAKRWTPAEPGTPPMSRDMPISYIVADAVTNIDTGNFTHPFGYPFANFNDGRTDESPKKLREVANPSLSWAMVDADQENASSQGPYYIYQPVTPAHGSVRNTLFFDWHIDAVKADAD